VSRQIPTLLLLLVLLPVGGALLARLFQRRGRLWLARGVGVGAFAATLIGALVVHAVSDEQFGAGGLIERGPVVDAGAYRIGPAVTAEPESVQAAEAVPMVGIAGAIEIEPTLEPSATPEPTLEPTLETTPSPEPTLEPTPTPEPTATLEPTPEPTLEPPPSPEPTPEPTLLPPTATPPPPPPTVPPPTVPPVVPTQPPSTQIRAYFVAPGDTLRSIAFQFGVSVDRLLEFNGLTRAQGDQLRPGQRLYIPATLAPPPPRQEVVAYVVQRGDTLRSISTQFGVSVDRLLEFNGLTRAQGDQLRPGQRLYIPANAPAARTPPPTATPQPRDQIVAYVVARGDTLRSIAARFGVSVERLLEFNGLTRAQGDQLRPGQRLYIPRR
jgi:LysM repeat protein